MHSKADFHASTFAMRWGSMNTALSIRAMIPLLIFLFLLLTLTNKPAKGQTFRVIHACTAGLDGREGPHSKSCRIDFQHHVAFWIRRGVRIVEDVKRSVGPAGGALPRALISGSPDRDLSFVGPKCTAPRPSVERTVTIKILPAYSHLFKLYL